MRSLIAMFRRPRVCRYMRRVGPILVVLEAPTIPELLALVDGLEARRQ